MRVRFQRESLQNVPTNYKTLTYETFFLNTEDETIPTRSLLRTSSSPYTALDGDEPEQKQEHQKQVGLELRSRGKKPNNL